MSYILDALKKAERERGLAAVPTLEAIHDLPQRNHSGAWAALGILVLCVLTALWLLYPSKKKDLRPPSQEVASASQFPDRSANTPLLAVVPSQPMLPAETPGLPLNKAVDKTDLAIPGPSSGARLSNAKPNTVARVLTPGSSDNLENVAQTKIPSRNVEAPSPAVQAKTASLNDEVAKMNMSIHLYSENKAERLVFINGKKYFEGDSLEQGIFLESITPEGAVLRSGGERAVLRPGSR
jgi:general secretion pathway protein B